MKHPPRRTQVASAQTPNADTVKLKIHVFTESIIRHITPIAMSSQRKTTSVRSLERRLEQCLINGRHALSQRLRGLGSKPDAAALKALQEAIEASVARRETRAKNRPRPEFPEALPVVARREEIARAIEAHQVVIVCGETGSGKTTQLPKICLELGRGTAGLIGHTQPRRIAARSVATRIAEELGGPIGQAVGYKVRFSDHVGTNSYIKLMTDGILLAEIQHDRYLEHYDTLIIDEAHERSLNIDFLLGYLKRVLPKRPDLKVIVTSATIDPERLSRHFDGAPVIEVSGRTYPVEVRYRPLRGEHEDERERDQQQALREAVDELHAEGPGDILVFLPGEREIREAAEILRKHHPKGLEILPLYARLSAAEQNRVFQGHAHRRVVLATNVAETSLTVPGIRYVIDTGTARISRYSWRAKVQRLPIEAVSRASADQRKGRCGRVAEGVCIRLYGEDDYNQRAPFTDPEILRTNLASVILQMAQLGLGDVTRFPFLEAPDARLIKDGYKLLFELGAVDDQQRITTLGRALARLPIDPRLARMLIGGREEGSLKEVLVIVSALAVQDPRERPHDVRQAADEQHARFTDPRSDFLAFLNLWNAYHEQARHLSRNKLRGWCREHFIAYLRMREWHDTHQQLRGMLHDMGIRENQVEADYATIHRALLSGLLGHIGFKDEGHEYLGARNRKFMIFPGSGLFKKGPKWIMAAELTETTRLYGRCVAKIEAQWLESLAGHLIKHHYFEPHWEKRPAQVAAYDKLTLYGLTINPRRRVHYGRLFPIEARELFIRAALVEGDYHGRAAFFEHNRALVEDIETLEAKTRRRDILVDEQVLYDFYDAHIPAHVHSGAAFERWRKEAERDNPRLLYLDKAELMQHEAGHVTAERYPDTLHIKGMALALSYHFEPGHEADGVTLHVPLAALNQIDEHTCEWLVPGLLEEKLAALIKTLPKPLRRNFVPAPDFARAALRAMKPGEGDLLGAFAHELLRMTGVEVAREAWGIDELPDHLRMRYAIHDAKGQTLKTARRLRALKEGLAGAAEADFQTLPTNELEREGLDDWDFATLPETIEIQNQGITLKAHPALIDRQTHVDIQLLDTAAKARAAHRQGVLRLYRLRLREQVKYLDKNLPGIDALCLRFATLGDCATLKDDIVKASLRAACLGEAEPPRDKAAFEATLEQGRGRLVETANEICRLIAPALEIHQAIRKRLKGKIALGWIEALKDVEDQLAHLIYPGFVSATPPAWLGELGRYLKAVERRLALLERQPDKDRHLRVQIEPVWADIKQRLQALGPSTPPDPELLRYRWMLEELRVSLFAQELGTAMPVSVKRLDKQRAKIDAPA